MSKLKQYTTVNFHTIALASLFTFSIFNFIQVLQLKKIWLKQVTQIAQLEGIINNLYEVW